MRIDFSIDVNRAVAPTVTSDFLNEALRLAVSAVAQGHAKGVGLHPGVTVEWTLTTDEDGAL